MRMRHYAVFTYRRRKRRAAEANLYLDILNRFNIRKEYRIYVRKGRRSGKFVKFMKNYHNYLYSDDYAEYN